MDMNVKKELKRSKKEEVKGEGEKVWIEREREGEREEVIEEWKQTSKRHNYRYTRRK